MDLNEKINFQEYDILMSILSNFKKDKLVDCLKVRKKKKKKIIIINFFLMNLKKIYSFFFF
jgi:hypothetical protein